MHHISEFNALMDRYRDALAAEQAPRAALEKAGVDPTAPFAPTLIETWFAKHELTERLFAEIMAMLRDGIAH